MRSVLFNGGFRPFFLLAALWAVLSLTIWIALLEGGGAPPSYFAPLDWHIHEMLFGLVMAAIAGFLFTAIPNWTGRPPLSAWPLLLLALLWLAGRVAVFFALTPAIDLAFTAALILIAGWQIAAAGNWRHVTVVIPLGVLFAANLLMHLGQSDLGWRLGLAAITFLVALIGGRIIPNFTRNWLKEEVESVKGLPVAALIALVLAMALWVAKLPGAGPLLLVAAILHGLLLANWRGLRCVAEPLLLILHIGYGWLVAGLALLGLGAPLGAAVHALTAGCFTVMILAVMTRATRGHTGRTLSADRPTTGIYVLANLAALTRVAAALFPAVAAAGYRLTALFWIAAWGLFLVSYGPYLLTKPAK